MNVNTVKLRNPLTRTDTYKFTHHDQVPEGMEKMYSHLTPRHNKYLKRRFPTTPDKVVVYGIQSYLRKLKLNWKENFFDVAWDKIEQATLEILTPHIGFTVENMERFKQLHDLGYLPLRIKALAEGSHVNLNIPILTVTNTIKKFHWLPNFLEPTILNHIYKPTTVATLTLELAKLRNRYVAETCPNSLGVPYMLHAFDFRGHPDGSAETSGSAYTLFTYGTDTLVGIADAQEMYDTVDAVAHSIPALEHSTATLGIQMYRNALNIYDAITEEELTNDKDAVDILAEKLNLSVDVVTPAYLSARSVSDYMKAINKPQEQIELAVGEVFNLVRLLLKVYPTGTFAYVADSYSYPRLISVILPAIASVIKNRDGKIVIRPDSGDPVQIVTGRLDISPSIAISQAILQQPLNSLFKVDGDFYKLVSRPSLREGMHLPFTMMISSGFIVKVNVEEGSDPFFTVIASEEKGSVETLWEIFGGTINSAGYKELDSHIGLVYGDGMIYDRIQQIYENLKNKNFAACNVCLAAGAYMLSSVSRDDLGFAIKASYAEVNGVGISVYKQPETDPTKASSKGMFLVTKDELGEYHLKEEATPEEESQGELQVVFLDGDLKNQTTYEEVKARVNKLL